MTIPRMNWTVVIAAAGVAMLAAAVALRRPSSPETLGRRPVVAAPTAVYYKPADIAVAPPPARPETVAQATEDARVKSTFQNYRNAIAQGNAVLQENLLPVLVRDRKMAVRLAEAELSRAESPFDREVAQKALESLRK